MQLSTLLTIALAAITQAAPSPSPAVEVQDANTVLESTPFPGADVSAQAVYGISLCTERNFDGEAGINLLDEWILFEENTLLTGTDNVAPQLNDRISSLRTQRRCTFWVDGGCRGNALILNAGNYPTISANYNDQISSWTCD
ncbi:hypothetical protein DL98DRAFT_588354 [Cadophora sp. DSE1049]|nr:hypothetical protein DL98DRAFT_588354 [Cadophora sp. DSE1049]